MRHRGFTLIELLLTVAIIGIAAGIVTLSVRGSEMRKLTEEGDRLAALFRMAASEARVGGRAAPFNDRKQFTLEGHGFRFPRLGVCRPEIDHIVANVRPAQRFDGALAPASHETEAGEVLEVFGQVRNNGFKVRSLEKALPFIPDLG